MSGLKLVIGSKNSSSWSLRPWLLLKHTGVPFEEVVIPMRRPDTRERILAFSPSGRVPVLMVGEVRIWDSLAIAEFLAEHDEKLWPTDARARAIARSVSAEMHSGFQRLRTFMPMDVTARFGPPGRLLTQVEADVRRVLEIWTDCRRRFGQNGPFLFGRFSIADAMYAPVCSRFTTYAVPLDPVSQAYVEQVMHLPAMLEWAEAAWAEVSDAVEPEHAGTRMEPAATPQRLPASFAPELPPAADTAPRGASVSVGSAMGGEPAPSRPQAAARPAPATAGQPSYPPGLHPKPQPAYAPAPVDAPPQPPEEPRTHRPIPSTIMIKPIGDGTRRRR